MHAHTLRHRHHHYHDLQYVILLLVMSTSFLSFIQSAGNAAQQLQIGVVTALAYTLWGVFHHIYDKSLNWKIVVEYGATSMFGVGILWALLSFMY